MRKALSWLVGIMWAVILLGGAFRPAPLSTQSTAAQPYAGYPAPPIAGQDINGGAVDLASLKGKTVLINFWASWCSPCRVEMPELERLAQAPPEGTAVIAINMTSMEESLDHVHAYLKQGGYSFPVWLDGNGAIARQYEVVSLPTSVVLSPDGMVAFRIIGPMSHAAMVDFLHQARR